MVSIRCGLKKKKKKKNRNGFCPKGLNVKKKKKKFEKCGKFLYCPIIFFGNFGTEREGWGGGSKTPSPHKSAQRYE
jgi:hypothetical protein